MCGIAGVVVGGSNIFDLEQLKHLMEHMLSEAAYRGPDASEVFCESQEIVLGHSRLSIIDLHEDSNQPMRYLNLVICFNGEIYNYLELKAELMLVGYEFSTESDTEVLLKAYHCWGEGCLQKLNGMFAFAVYDIETGEVFLARDRLGEKPLYYIEQDNNFIFSSEIKQIFASNLVDKKINKIAVTDYLTMQYSLSADTFFSNVYRLMPGHTLRYTQGVINIKQYWDIEKISQEQHFDPINHGDKLKAAIETSVALRLRSDVPICGYLSAGLDSNIVCSLASRASERQFRTFTFASQGKMDESADAQRSADIYGTEHRKTLMPEGDFLSLWQHMSHIMDEPAVGYSLVPQYLMSDKVRQYSTVVLGGQGGDEIFFGYGWHTILMIRQLNPIRQFPLLFTLIKNHFSGGLKAKLRNLYTLVTLRGSTLEQRYFNLWKANGCFIFLRNDLQNSVNQRFLEAVARPSSESSVSASFDKLRIFELKYWLQGLLQVEDRCSMACSIEARIPLLDHNVVELASVVPVELCVDGGYNKSYFKELFRDSVPDFITRSKNKSGYQVPLDAWLKEESVVTFLASWNGDKAIKDFLNSFFISDFTLDQLSMRQIWMVGSLVMWADSNGFIQRA